MSELNNNENKLVNEQAEGTYSGQYFEPRMDIYETEQALIMEGELPGISEEDVDIDLHDNELTIMAKQKAAEKDENSKYLLQEFAKGHYLRRFSLPERLDQSRIIAEMKNGILQITLPKAEKASPRKIAINNN